MDFPRLVISGIQSGVGKTTLSLGIMRALRNRGFNVQPFKAGPDYIDPGLHYKACGFKSYNLDTWMGTDAVVKTVFAKNAKKADISVIEGVMGLFDGLKGSRMKGSTAELAMILNAPVILMINVRGMAQSCAAVIKGFITYEPGIKLQGVVLNNCSEYHRDSLRYHIEKELNIKVLGCLPRRAEIKMPSRHLGLMPAEENQELQISIAKMAELIEENVDMDAIIELAKSAEPFEISRDCLFYNEKRNESQVKLRIGVAWDQAFTFYYQDNLDYLQELGAELVFFSPMQDENLPEVDGVYFGGGFPELFLPALSDNQSMIISIQEAYKQTLPIYAECGGYLYMCEQIEDFDGVSWPGAGIVPATVRMSKSLQGLGYVEAQAMQNTVLCQQGVVLRGHEFHYSMLDKCGDNTSAYRLKGGKGADGRRDGYVQGNLLASYVHLHFRSNPFAALNFINACEAFNIRKMDSKKMATGEWLDEQRH